MNFPGHQGETTSFDSRFGLVVFLQTPGKIELANATRSCWCKDPTKRLSRICTLPDPEALFIPHMRVTTLQIRGSESLYLQGHVHATIPRAPNSAKWCPFTSFRHQSRLIRIRAALPSKTSQMLYIVETESP